MTLTKWDDVAKHAFEALLGEMGVMQIQLWEVTLERDALCEELATCQTKCLGLEQDVANQQKALEEAFAKAIEAKKEHMKSMENIEHYYQTLIDMKEDL